MIPTELGEDAWFLSLSLSLSLSKNSHPNQEYDYDYDNDNRSAVASLTTIGFFILTMPGIIEPDHGCEYSRCWSCEQ